MRFTSLAILASTLVALTAAPAQAAWTYYISHPLGFSFALPGPMSTSTGTYQTPVAGKLKSMVFTSTANGVTYTATVVDTTPVQNKAATLLLEAAYNFQDGKKLLMDVPGRVDRNWGRRLSVDLPNNGGRLTSAFWFVHGRLLELRATVPVGGDYNSPEIARFIDSIAFYPDMANAQSLELTLPK